MRPGFNVLSWSRQKTRGTYFLTTDRLPTMARPIGRQKPIKRTPVPCHPPPFMRKPQNSSVPPEKPCHLRKTQKEHPCLIFYKYVLCTFIHQKVRHDFGSIDLDHKPQAKQAPRRDPSPWYCIHIMLTVTARYMIRSLQRHSGLFKQQGLGIEVGLLLGSLYIAGLYTA
jgi:hypothetical protein